jgi:hypothetical protein
MMCAHCAQGVTHAAQANLSHLWFGDATRRSISIPMWPLRSGYLSGRLAIAAKLVLQYCALDPAATTAAFPLTTEPVTIELVTTGRPWSVEPTTCERDTLALPDTMDWLRTESDTVAAPFTVLWSRDDWRRRSNGRLRPIH